VGAWALALSRVIATAVFLVAAALARDSVAHKSVPSERGILQFKAERTELLYELLIPGGATAAHWRLRFDANHDGRLSDKEYERLAQGLAEQLRSKLTLRLEGNVIPVTVVDAKITSTDADDHLSGRLSALIWLSAREIPPGRRTVELELTPVADPTEPAMLRLEPVEATVDSVTGALRVKLEDGSDGVRIREGMRCKIVLDVPLPKAQ
jgi:hypothetical protein